MSKSQLDLSKGPDSEIRLVLYKTAHLEAKTLVACGWKASEISITELYERLLKEQADGELTLPTKKEFKGYEASCRARGINPYRL